MSSSNSSTEPTPEEEPLPVDPTPMGVDDHDLDVVADQLAAEVARVMGGAEGPPSTIDGSSGRRGWFNADGEQGSPGGAGRGVGSVTAGSPPIPPDLTGVEPIWDPSRAHDPRPGLADRPRAALSGPPASERPDPGPPAGSGEPVPHVGSPAPLPGPQPGSGSGPPPLDPLAAPAMGEGPSHPGSSGIDRPAPAPALATPPPVPAATTPSTPAAGVGQGGHPVDQVAVRKLGGFNFLSVGQWAALPRDERARLVKGGLVQFLHEGAEVPVRDALVWFQQMARAAAPQPDDPPTRGDRR